MFQSHAVLLPANVRLPVIADRTRGRCAAPEPEKVRLFVHTFCIADTPEDEPALRLAGTALAKLAPGKMNDYSDMCHPPQEIPA